MRNWVTGLCSCTSDWSSCCLSLWMPCIQFGINEEKMGEGDCCCCCTMYLVCFPFTCCFLWNQRGKVRAKYGISGDSCDDCCAALCCHYCTLCQLAREIDYFHPKFLYM